LDLVQRDKPLDYTPRRAAKKRGKNAAKDTTKKRAEAPLGGLTRPLLRKVKNTTICGSL
jgi:hypothetical protein